MRARLARELGYQSAKVGADAAIFDADGRVLLVHRSDDLRWGLIAGWVDPGETPPDTVVREVQRGGRPRGHRRSSSSTWSGARPGRGTARTRSVSVLYLCTVAPGPVTISHEAIAAGYRHPEDVDEWHANHEQLALLAREHWRARRA